MINILYGVVLLLVTTANPMLVLIVAPHPTAAMLSVVYTVVTGVLHWIWLHYHFRGSK